MDRLVACSGEFESPGLKSITALICTTLTDVWHCVLTSIPIDLPYSLGAQGLLDVIVELRLTHQAEGLSSIPLSAVAAVKQAPRQRLCLPTANHPNRDTYYQQ